MAGRQKTFDCVAFKRQAQRKLREEYETRRDEFDSYWDFLDAKAQESEWVQRMEQRFPLRG